MVHQQDKVVRISWCSVERTEGGVESALVTDSRFPTLIILMFWVQYTSYLGYYTLREGPHVLPKCMDNGSTIAAWTRTSEKRRTVGNAFVGMLRHVGVSDLKAPWILVKQAERARSRFD